MSATERFRREGENFHEEARAGEAAATIEHH
jgi:hypothetical protein